MSFCITVRRPGLKIPKAGLNTGVPSMLPTENAGDAIGYVVPGVGPGIRTLTLVTAGLPQSDPAKEGSDKARRTSLYERTLKTDVLNETFLSKSSPWRRWLYNLLPFTVSQIVEAFILGGRYDVVISWSERPALLFALVLKLTGSKIRHVALMTWPSRPKKAMVLKWVQSHICTLVLWSSVQRDFVVDRLGLPPDKIRMVRNPVDQEFFRPLNRETDMICSAGREMRDYPTLIEAMRGLDIKCHVAVYLRGKMYDTVKAAISDRTIPSNVTIGNLTDLELRELYARSRFVVIPLLPTDTDNGVTVIAEAMAMGKAVICSRVKGQVDIIKEGVSGLLVPQGDPAALRRAIKHLWDHPELADKMGREGRKIIEEYHTLERFVNDMKEIATEAAGKKNSTTPALSTGGYAGSSSVRVHPGDAAKSRDKSQREVADIKSGRSLRSLTLITEGLPEINLAKEKADETPRYSLYETELGTDMLNERYLLHAKPSRRWLYRRLPFAASQIIEAYLQRKRYDVVISWAERPALLYATALKLTGSRVPHVALMSWISKPKKARILKLVHSHITTIVLWSSIQRDFAINQLGIPPEKIRMITKFADERFFRPMGRETDMICSAGREMRDYPTLIEAMRGLDIKCHIAVRLRGKMYDTVKAAMAEKSLPSNVTIEGLRPYELREMYARSRFVVIPLLPTDTDNGLTVLLEAMAMGKAVICSRVKGQIDIIKEGVTGILVPQGDPVSLRNAIDHLWNHPEIAEKMGREARKVIEEKHTIEGFVNTMKDVIYDAAGVKPPGTFPSGAAESFQ